MSLLTGKVSDFLKIGVAAAGRGDLETVRLVLAEKPGWLLRVGSHGRTMLWEAAYRGRLAMVEWLLNQGSDVHAWGCHFTPLLVDISPYCAARFKNHDAVADVLWARGASTDIYTFAYLGDGEAVVACLRRDPGLATAERVQHDTNVRATVSIISFLHLNLMPISFFMNEKTLLPICFGVCSRRQYRISQR